MTKNYAWKKRVRQRAWKEGLTYQQALAVMNKERMEKAASTPVSFTITPPPSDEEINERKNEEE